MAAILVWWLLSARKWFKGPRVNVQHLMGEEIRGQEVDDGSEKEGTEGTPRKGSGSELSPDGLQRGDVKAHGL